MKIRSLFICLVIFQLYSCAVIRPGQVGIKQRLGKFTGGVVKEGTVFYNPITSKVVKESTQTQNIKLILSLPSKEGLSVQSEISILYKLKDDMVASILENLGKNYESIVTKSNKFTSAGMCTTTNRLSKDNASCVTSSSEKYTSRCV